MDYDLFLKDLVEKIQTFCLSVMLIGSRARGCETPESDIDIVVIAKEKESVKQIHSLLQLQTQLNDNLQLDCKVFTESEFQKAKNGQDNFYWWNALEDARVLFGNDSWCPTKLIHSNTSSLLWNCITELENAFTMLEAQTQFTGACYRIVSSLKTIFFAERIFLQKTEEEKRKDMFLRDTLGDQYDIASSRYNWVSQQLGDSLDKKLKVSSKIDRKFKKQAYLRMYDKSVIILDLVKKRVPELMKKIESSNLIS